MHRLDALPKSETGMSMNAWKSIFANSKKNPPQAMEWFWAHYDPTGFSIWFQVRDNFISIVCMTEYLTYIIILLNAYDSF